MFVLTAKLSKSKLLAAGLILLAAILIIILLATSGGGLVTDSAPVGETNDDRIAYLATFGWSVNGEPTEVQKVKIPDAADNEVFARYNDLQKSQGFDLTAYAGKEAMRYVYVILNYPDATQPVYASILVYEGRIIGGDVTNTAPDGIIHGFQKPGETLPTEDTSSATEPTELPAETDESMAPSQETPAE